MTGRSGGCSRPPRAALIVGLWLVAALGLAQAADVTGNLVTDGGMETWNATGPQGGVFGWDYLTVANKQVDLARDEQGRVLTPTIMSQFSDTQLVRPEAQDAHGGQKALRLKGALYLRESSGEAYQAQDGDIYLVRYWVKGEGQSLMHFTVYGDAAVQTLEVKGRPEKDRWSAIEERIQVVGRAPTTIYPRLWASAEMLIDDVSVVRVIRPGEIKLQEVPADMQDRIAFASPAGGAITVDGKLDEAGWGRALAFGGFRPHGDQMSLAPVQPAFRVLFDEQALYLGVEVPLPGAAQVREELLTQPLLDAAGQPLPRVDTWNGRHTMEFFLQAPGQSGYRQLAVTLDGYRFDSTGMDKSWNGAWEFAVNAAEDRWFVEMKVPVRDLGVERTSPAEGWRLNLCCDQPGGSATWAAVGGNFHNPDAFGQLIVQDFSSWQAAQPERLQQQRAAIAQAAGAQAPQVAARLAALEAAAATGAAGEAPQDWQGATRAYARLDYLGRAARCLAEEVRYRGFFQ